MNRRHFIKSLLVAASSLFIRVRSPNSDPEPEVLEDRCPMCGTSFYERINGGMRIDDYWGADVPRHIPEHVIDARLQKALCLQRQGNIIVHPDARRKLRGMLVKIAHKASLNGIYPPKWSMVVHPDVFQALREAGLN